jgi:hypothetical protein
MRPRQLVVVARYGIWLEGNYSPKLYTAIRDVQIIRELREFGFAH